jgi:putative sigma-54 modulation protein
MITSIELSGIGYQIDERTKKYAMKKIARLDKYLPRHARQSVKAEVKLREVNKDHGNKYQAEIILHVPDKTLTAKDSTVNMIAAIDIVEAKIVGQLRRYKQAVLPHVGQRRVLSRLRQGYGRELQ